MDLERILRVTHNIAALFRVVNDVFGELTDTNTFISNVCLTYSVLYIHSVNFVVIFRTIANILKIYFWGILIWATR